MAERLLAAGFAPWSDASREPIVAGGKYFTVRNDSSLIAFTAGKDLSRDYDSWVPIPTVPIYRFARIRP